MLVHASAVTFLQLLAALRLISAYRQPFDYISAVNAFADAFTNPSSVIDDKIPIPLSENVVGRIDIISTIVGQELNVDYLFGLFVQDASQNTTQLIGTPSSFMIQSLVVEPPVVAVSFINELVYPTVNLSVPLQVDMFMAFDDDLKIISYDAIIRRWSEFMTYTIPLLAPRIAEELNSTTTNQTALINLKTATDVCAMSTQYCTGTNLQYSSHDACMEFMLALPFGQPWEGGMNNGWCRYIQKNMVKNQPGAHCPNIGPTGGSMCITRDYGQVTGATPFNVTLLSYNSSYNPLDVKSVPVANQLELIKADTEVIYMTTVAFYSISCILYMLLLTVSGKAIEFVLHRFSTQYRTLSFANQRNTVTYFMDTFYTTGALALQIASWPILDDRYTYANIGMLKVTALIISGLYIFELTYRVSMRWPLTTHHFCTIFSTVLLLSILSYTKHPPILGAGEIWLFQATTEQSIFIGLIMYRLRCSPERTRNVLYFAAIQSFILKFTFAVYLLVFWGKRMIQYHASDDVALSVLLVTMIALLMCTQVYGTWAVWGLAAKVNRSLTRRASATPLLFDDSKMETDSFTKATLMDDVPQTSLSFDPISLYSERQN